MQYIELFEFIYHFLLMLQKTYFIILHFQSLKYDILLSFNRDLYLVLIHNFQFDLHSPMSLSSTRQIYIPTQIHTCIRVFIYNFIISQHVIHELRKRQKLVCSMFLESESFIQYYIMYVYPDTIRLCSYKCIICS